MHKSSRYILALAATLALAGCGGGTNVTQNPNTGGPGTVQLQRPAAAHDRHPDVHDGALVERAARQPLRRLPRRQPVADVRAGR